MTKITDSEKKQLADRQFRAMVYETVTATEEKTSTSQKQAKGKMTSQKMTSQKQAKGKMTSQKQAPVNLDCTYNYLVFLLTIFGVIGYIRHLSI